GFGLDTYRIDARMNQVQQARAAAGLGGGVQQTARVQVQDQPGGGAPSSLGAELLTKARLEFSHQNNALAPRLAEDAYKNHPQVRTDAEAVLRMIDVEEFNQAQRTANRTFDAAVQAFNRRDYGHASQLFRAFDPRCLEPAKQARLKEYMSVPEMQRVQT